MDSFSRAGNSALDDLFLERLDAFIDKTLSDMKTFAEREGCSLDIVRRHVAQWHSQSLFSVASPSPPEDRRQRVNLILVSTSQTLEALHQTAGLHSFFLAVDPTDPTDNGFLGGTVLGREFWRGLRNGGVNGAKAFKMQAMSSHSPTLESFHDHHQAPSTSMDKRTPAQRLKSEVYAGIRTALRMVSGIRNAEMRWTNHDLLQTYGVRIDGWPKDIPKRNPSSLTVAENKRLKECLQNESLIFHRLDGQDSPITASAPGSSSLTANVEDASGPSSWPVVSPSGNYLSTLSNADSVPPIEPPSNTASHLLSNAHFLESKSPFLSGPPSDSDNDLNEQDDLGMFVSTGYALKKRRRDS